MKLAFLDLVILATIFCNCTHIQKPENPYDLAQEYCECFAEELLNAADSTVNPNVCNKIFYKSRLMTIHLGQSEENYTQNTKDSATLFFGEVASLIDRLCYSNKIETKKLKKLPHAPM